MVYVKTHTKKTKKGKIVTVKSYTRKQTNTLKSKVDLFNHFKTVDLAYDKMWNKPHSWNDEKWIGIIHLTPQEFLNKVPSLKYVFSKSSEKYITKELKAGNKVEMPFFEVGSDNKFHGHEGRHRAYVAKKVGIRNIPVAIYWYGGYRNNPDANYILANIKKYKQGDLIL